MSSFTIGEAVIPLMALLDPSFEQSSPAFDGDDSCVDHANDPAGIPCRSRDCFFYAVSSGNTSSTRWCTWQPSPALLVRSADVHAAAEGLATAFVEPTAAEVFAYLERTPFDGDRDDTIEEITRTAEVALFVDCYLRWFAAPAIRDPLMLSRGEMQALCRQYGSWLSEIRRLASTQDMELEGAPFESRFDLLNRVVSAEYALSLRWVEFVLSYMDSRHGRTRYDREFFLNSKQEWADIRNISALEEAIERDDNLKLIKSRSFADLFVRFEGLERRLKKKIMDDCSSDPEKVTGLLKWMHAAAAFSENLVQGDLIDWLLGISSGSVDEAAFISQVRGDRMLSEQWAYGGTPYDLISGFLRLLDPGPSDVFYDLGSGLGRPTLMAGMLTKVRVKGVEMVPERVAKADSVRRWLGLDNVSYHLGYAGDGSVDIGDGTIFFLFNPFARATLRRVTGELRGIAARKAARGERIRIVSYGDCTDAFLLQRSWLSAIHAVGEIRIFESLC